MKEDVATYFCQLSCCKYFKPTSQQYIFKIWVGLIVNIKIISYKSIMFSFCTNKILYFVYFGTIIFKFCRFEF